MHRIDGTKNIRMPHTETDCAISPHKYSGDSPRIPRGQALEIPIDVGHQFFDHEVFPIPRHRGIHVPGSTERGGHIDRDENEAVDHSPRNGSIEEALGIVLLEIEAVAAFERVRKEVDYRIALRG